MNDRNPPTDPPLEKLYTGEETPEKLRVAIAITLLEAAHASSGLASQELLRISAPIFTHFGMSDAEIGHLIEVSELIRKDEVKKRDFLQDLAINFTLGQRQEILSIVWRILIVDGQVDADEARVAVEIRKALELSIEAAVASRERAERTEIEILMKSLKRTEDVEELLEE